MALKSKLNRNPVVFSSEIDINEIGVVDSGKQRLSPRLGRCETLAMLESK